MPKKAAVKRKGSGAPTGVPVAKKNQKEKQVIYCLEKPDGQRTFVMNEEALNALSVSGCWIFCASQQCKDVGEAVAWTRARSKATKPPPNEMDKPSSGASSEESEERDNHDVGNEGDGEDEDNEVGANLAATDDNEEGDARGSPVKTEKHKLQKLH